MIRQTGIGIIGASLLVVGCGGGDGGGDGVSVGPAPTALITTQAEADAITSYVLSMTSGTELDPTGMVGLSVVAPSSGGTGLSIDLEMIGDIAKRYTDLARESKTATSDPLALLATETIYIPCDSGTGTIVLAYSDPSQDTVGDSISITFSNCVMTSYDPDLGVNVTAMMNGALAGTLASLGPGVNDLSANYTYTNLSVTDVDSGVSSSINGGFTAAFSGDGYVSELQTTISGTSLAVTETAGGASQTHTLSNFSLASSTSYANSTHGFSHNYTVTSSEIGGTISVTTVTPFVSALYVVDAYPTEGQMVITGGSGAKVRVTAQPDGTNVFIEYDIDPVDGTYESSTTKTWNTL